MAAGAFLITVPAPAASTESKPPSVACDEVPTGVAISDYWLHFKLPPGLMPDAQFDNRPAKITVHRVRPVYANGRCASVPARAAVLIHGRTTPGPVVFDLRDALTGGGELSVQEALARAGIDTLAPSLLGFGRSTRFDEGLNDPGNASLRPYAGDGTCPFPEGCDRTTVPWSLDQQGTMLGVNPLAGVRRAHSSSVRFARVDVWVRDIRHVIDDAIARAQPTDGKVVLVGYSAGGQRVGRTMYAANPVLTGSADVIAKVSRVVFVSSIFGGPTEETPPATGFPTFPLAGNDAAGSNAAWAMPPGRDATCSGHIIPGTQEQAWAQTMKLDPIGARLGCPEVGVPGGSAASSAIYDALPPSMTNKVLVQVRCASHALPLEGCAGARCMPAVGMPYGGAPDTPWDGPHATLKAALIEWISAGSFDGAAHGRFLIDESGVSTPAES